MRVLYSHCLPTDDHPAARMVGTVAGELERLGHEVRVHRTFPAAGAVAPGTTPATNARGGVLRPVRRGLWFAKELARTPGAYRRDAAAVRAFRPDVVLARQDAYCFSMPLAARRAGVPLVTYADAPVAYESRHYNPGRRWHPPRLVEAIEKWGLTQSRAVVTVSRPAARVLARYGVNVPITVAPNGVDAAGFTPPSAEARAAVRAELGIGTPHVAGFVGTFGPFHGLPLLRDLIQRTAGRTDLTWLLVGDGPGRADLEAAVGGPRVVFTGRQPKARAAALMAAADVLVAPHQRAAAEFYFCPLKVLEAMAAGVPSVASDQGDVPALLDHGRAGTLVPTDRPEDWANALNALLDDPAARRRMGDAARRRAGRNYSWAATAAAVSAVLEGAAVRPGPAVLPFPRPAGAR